MTKTSHRLSRTQRLKAAQKLAKDPERQALIAEVGPVCPCGIDLTLCGCYRCLKARGAVWTCSREAEEAFHGSPNPNLVGYEQH